MKSTRLCKPEASSPESMVAGSPDEENWSRIMMAADYKSMLRAIESSYALDDRFANKKENQ